MDSQPLYIAYLVPIAEITVHLLETKQNKKVSSIFGYSYHSMDRHSAQTTCKKARGPTFDLLKNIFLSKCILANIICL